VLQPGTFRPSQGEEEYSKQKDHPKRLRTNKPFQARDETLADSRKKPDNRTLLLLTYGLSTFDLSRVVPKNDLPTFQTITVGAHLGYTIKNWRKSTVGIQIDFHQSARLLQHHNVPPKCYIPETFVPSQRERKEIDTRTIFSSSPNRTTRSKHQTRPTDSLANSKTARLVQP
jgi:hypothetical protein